MPHIRFVVLRGADGLFSSGGDLSQLRDGLPEDYLADYDERMLSTIGAIAEMDQIVISAIEGAAIGAALALAMSADLVVCEEDAMLRMSFVHIGFVPDAGATYVAPALAGAVGRDLLLTGRPIAPAEAQAYGLISRVCPAGTIDAELEALLAELRMAPPHALALTKGLINGRTRDDYLDAVHKEGALQPVAAALTSAEHIDLVFDRIRRRQAARVQNT